MKMYFSFGSAKQFPYGREDYVLVIGTDAKDCLTIYRLRHPDVHEDTVNCADYYTEKQWCNSEGKYHEGKKPAETLVSAKAERVYEELRVMKGED